MIQPYFSNLTENGQINHLENYLKYLYLDVSIAPSMILIVQHYTVALHPVFVMYSKEVTGLLFCLITLFVHSSLKHVHVLLTLFCLSNNIFLKFFKLVNKHLFCLLCVDASDILWKISAIFIMCGCGLFIIFFYI